MTLRDLQTEAARRLAELPQLREDAGRDALMLLLHALSLPRVAVYTDSARLVDEEEVCRVYSLIDRRLNFEPIQYIVGEQEFYGLSFNVTPATLIPRPETELLVEAVLDRVPVERELLLVDVGTGSGAIAVALAHHLPLARIVALDLSPEALAIAKTNARRNAVAARIDFYLSDLCAAIPVADPIDAIVSNPPYVPEGDRPTLHPQVRDYEPATALFAGHDGLSTYRRLIPQAATHLNPGGLLAMEFGYNQSDALFHLLRGWARVEFLNDLQGIPRVVLARKPL